MNHAKFAHSLAVLPPAAQAVRGDGAQVLATDDRESEAGDVPATSSQTRVSWGQAGNLWRPTESRKSENPSEFRKPHAASPKAS